MNRNSARSALEHLIFGRRLLVVISFTIISILLAFQAVKIRPDASLERMIPLEHPYIINFLEHRADLENLANFVRISVEAKEGDIFDAQYMATLEAVGDEAFYLPGVDRAGLKSLWTANVRWVEVTEQGFAGGPVIPNGYDGSDESLHLLRQNVLRSGQIGRLVANDFKSSIVYVPLLETNPKTGESLDYHDFSLQLEEKIRRKFSGPNAPTNIQIVGFAKKIGDMIEGLGSIVFFFAIAAAITTLMLYYYCRCIKSSLVAVLCSSVAVVWQLGLMKLLGYGLDPYSVLIPFIVFATAISHGVQFINGMNRDAGLGMLPIDASIDTFRHHFVPAMLALVSDAIGFFTLVLIDVDVIKDLAVGASLGIASIIITNMVLLPIVMSYIGLTKRGLAHAKYVESNPSRIWRNIARIATRKGAFMVVILALLGVGVGLYLAQDLKVGELDAGAPELQPDSRYNLDNAFITEHYSTSADVMVLMVKAPEEQCSRYSVLQIMDRLQWRLDHAEGVQSSVSIVNVSKAVTKAFNEGSFKWLEISRNQRIIDSSLQHVPDALINGDCSLTPILVFLNDHRAETLQGVVDDVENFIAENDMGDFELLLAAGNAGIEVATNQVIAASQILMMVVVYAVVAVMVLAAYRSIRAAICIVLPLGVTSILCMALMSVFGIGVKVSTLPIIALGVGLGVDYGIYIFSRLQELLDEGLSLEDAYYETLRTTGKAVAFTGLTLAIGTATWIFSPIKFQSDMGLLLTFMFVWNMIGAMTLLPALSYYFLRVDTDNEGLKSTLKPLSNT